MLENIIVGGIVLLCIILIGRRIYRQLRGRSGCGCSCDSCPTSTAGQSTEEGPCRQCPEENSDKPAAAGKE
jgi:hypothetical protein